MGKVLTCALCVGDSVLSVPLSLAHLMVLHVVIDHEWPMDQVERVHRIPLVGGRTVWGLGSRGRKAGQFIVWRATES